MNDDDYGDEANKDSGDNLSRVFGCRMVVVLCV